VFELDRVIKILTARYPHIFQKLLFEEQNMLKEVSFVKEWLEESLAEGRAVGREEGHTFGLREGQIKIILKLIQSILGRVEGELENKIRSLDDANIEKLSEDLLKIKNTADLVQWLKQREKNNKN